MKAWRVTSFGIDNLELAELAEPEPGPTQVVIKVNAVSLNYRDLMVVKGLYNPKLKMPRIPCSDGAGEIVAVGAEVSGAGPTGLKVGDRVTGIFMQNWLDGPPTPAKVRGALGGDIDGMLAEYVVLDQNGVATFPAHLSFDEAATLPCAALTAWNALTRAGNIKAGNTVVIQGTGGVSLFALQFAKMMGARVLGTSSSDAKLVRAKALGLDEGLNYKSTPDWASWVLEQTGGLGADLVVEVGGADTFQPSIKAARMAGVVAQIGGLTGRVTDPSEPLDLASILHRQIEVKGVYVGSRDDLVAMNRAIAQNGLHPVIDRVFPFEDAPEAFRTMEKGTHFGKQVVQIGSIG